MLVVRVISIWAIWCNVIQLQQTLVQSKIQHLHPTMAEIRSFITTLEQSSAFLSYPATKHVSYGNFIPDLLWPPPGRLLLRGRNYRSMYFIPLMWTTQTCRKFKSFVRVYYLFYELYHTLRCPHAYHTFCTVFFFGHRPKWFWNDRKTSSRFSQNVWKYTRMSTATANFNKTVRMTKMSQQKMTKTSQRKKNSFCRRRTWIPEVHRLTGLTVLGRVMATSVSFNAKKDESCINSVVSKLIIVVKLHKKSLRSSKNTVTWTLGTRQLMHLTVPGLIAHRQSGSTPQRIP